MPKLTYHCPACEKQLVLEKEFTLDGVKLFQYKCGHIFSKDVTSVNKSNLDFTSVDGSGKIARPYQEDGVQFILQSDFNAVIGDQMRLGKTPQALLALKNAYKERTPALILVRSANLWQWVREYKVWCDALPNGIWPITSTSAWIPPGFSAYIISMDTFAAQSKCTCGHRFHEQKCKSKNCECRVFKSDGNSIVDKLKKIPFKLIIADEAHSFKNTDSNRSQALVEFVAFLNSGEEPFLLPFACSRCGEEWEERGKRTYDKRIGHSVLSKSSKCPNCGQYCYQQQQHDDRERGKINPKVQERLDRLIALSQDQSTTEPERNLALTRANEIKEANQIRDEKPCGLILLTGTAIKNRAEEYFVPLNLVNPEKFSSLERFRQTWLEQDHKGRWSRIKRHRLDEFKELISSNVLRREKEDVFTDLPPLNRIFTVIDPDRDALVNAYNKILDQVEVKLADKVNPSFWDMKEDLMELRRICGLMKVPWVSDYLETSLEDSENQRYAVGIHHHSVRDVLYHKLGGNANCLKLSGEDQSWIKDKIMREFENSPQRVLIINMLAGGVGMDFHYCNNVLILERQWSSADEEQFEFRFYNPDKNIKVGSTNVEYVLIKGSIEQWFFDMVEEKRRIFGETISNHWDMTQDNGSFRDLLEKTVASRL